MPFRRLLRATAALCALAAATSCAGKRGDPRAPEQAYLQLLDAADTGDGARLFDALDTPTRWAIETVHKAQREMRKLIIESQEAWPPAERDAALARLPAACEEELERPRRYFRRLDDTAAALAEIKRRLYLGQGQPVGSVRKDRGEAEVWREGGSVFRFSRDDGGRWGYAELQDGWERAKERALRELETVRENAALYRRRAGTAAPAPVAPAPVAPAPVAPAPVAPTAEPAAPKGIP